MRIKKNGKLINLTESDLKRIVKKVLTEQKTVGNFVDKVSGQSGTLNRLGDTPVKAILPQLVGALVGLGVGVITKIKRDKRQKQLSNLLSKLNRALDDNMSSAEIRCLSKNLSSKGKITKLNDITDSLRKEEILKAIEGCVGDDRSEASDRSEDISVKLNDYITRIEEEKQKIKDEKNRQKKITSIK